MLANLHPAIPQAAQNTEEKNMNQFYDERNAAHRVVRDSGFDKDHAALKHFHINPEQPKTPRQVMEWMAAGHFAKMTDEELDKESEYEHPIHRFEFRKHPADEKGHEVYLEKHRKAKTALKLDIDTLDPKDFNPKVHEYLNKTFH